MAIDYSNYTSSVQYSLTANTTSMTNITIQTISSGSGAGGNYFGGYSSLGAFTSGTLNYGILPYQEKWPDVEGSVGLIFIKDDKVMIKLDDGEQKEIADLNESEIEIMTSLLAIAAKKRLQRT